MKVKSLEIIVVMLLILSEPAQSNKCRIVEPDNFGCYFRRIESEGSWCEVETITKPNFSIYIKPEHNFRELSIRIQRKDGQNLWVGSYEQPHYDHTVFSSFANIPDKWYKIRFQSKRFSWENQKMAYNISIEGQRELLFDELTLGTSAAWFTIYLLGSLFYANGCNPADFPKQRLTTPLIHPILTRSDSISTSDPYDMAPSRNYGFSDKIEIVTLTTDPITAVNTENGYNHDSKVDSNNSQWNTTLTSNDLLMAGEFWWIFIIIGAVIMIIIIVIIVAISRRKNAKKQNEVSAVDKEMGVSNKIDNDHERQAKGRPPPTGASDDLANNVYDGPQDYKNEEHIYEEMDDLQTPVSFVNDEAEHSAYYPGTIPARPDMDNQVEPPWHTRRGSAHDSENSLYGCL